MSGTHVQRNEHNSLSLVLKLKPRGKKKSAYITILSSKHFLFQKKNKNKKNPKQMPNMMTRICFIQRQDFVLWKQFKAVVTICHTRTTVKPGRIIGRDWS